MRFAPHTVPYAIIVACACAGPAERAAPLPDLAVTPEWTVASIRTIGGPNSELFRVRSARRLSSGDLAVANAGTTEILFFDSTGRKTGAVGRAGDGPQEFKFVSSMVRLRGDTLLVTVGPKTLARVTRDGVASIFTLDVNYDRFWRDSRAQSALILADETLLVELDHDRPQTGRFRTLTRYGLLRSGATVSSFLATEGLEHVSPPGDQMGDRTKFVRFSPYSVITTGPTEIYVGDTSEFTIHVYATDGTLLRSVTRSVKPRRVTATEKGGEKRRLTQAVESAVSPDARRRAEFQLRNVEFSDYLPAFGDIAVDSEGFLWIQEYVTSQTGERPLWLVVDETGRSRAHVRIPRMRILDIGIDYIIGVDVDDLGIERITTLKLNRSSG